MKTRSNKPKPKAYQLVVNPGESALILIEDKTAGGYHLLEISVDKNGTPRASASSGFPQVQYIGVEGEKLP